MTVLLLTDDGIQANTAMTEAEIALIDNCRGKMVDGSSHEGNAKKDAARCESERWFRYVTGAKH